MEREELQRAFGFRRTRNSLRKEENTEKSKGEGVRLEEEGAPFGELQPKRARERELFGNSSKNSTKVIVSARLLDSAIHAQLFRRQVPSSLRGGLWECGDSRYILMTCLSCKRIYATNQLHKIFMETQHQDQDEETS